jgi:hypothetical protein
MIATAGKVEFRKTPKRFVRWRILALSRWISRDGLFYVERSRYLGLGGSKTLPTVWRAAQRDPITGRWEILGRHRSRAAAERTIARAAGTK